MAKLLPHTHATRRASTSAKRHALVTRTVGFVVMIAVGLFFFLPWLWLVSSSLKTSQDIFAQPPQWIPSTIEWQNYVNAVTYVPFFKYATNTLLICAGVVLGRMISCSLVAYGFSKVNWPGRDKVFLLVLMTLMLPFQVTMIPLFVIFRNLGMIDTPLPLILPAFFGDAFFIFLLRQFFMRLPTELSEAARIDGANHFDIYWRVVLPLSGPALSTLVVFSFLWTYTDFQGPLVYLSSEDSWTLSLGLRGYLGAHGGEWSLLMAASVLFTVPVIVLFFVAQRAFIHGIATTGLR